MYLLCNLIPFSCHNLSQWFLIASFLLFLARIKVLPSIPLGCSLVWSFTFDHLVLTHFLQFTLCDNLLHFHGNQRHSYSRNQVHVQSYLCQFPRLLNDPHLQCCLRSSIMSKHVFSSFAIKAFAQDWSKAWWSINMRYLEFGCDKRIIL